MALNGQGTLADCSMTGTAGFGLTATPGSTVAIANTKLQGNRGGNYSNWGVLDSTEELDGANKPRPLNESDCSIIGAKFWLDGVSFDNEGFDVDLSCCPQAKLWTNGESTAFELSTYTQLNPDCSVDQQVSQTQNVNAFNANAEGFLLSVPESKDASLVKLRSLLIARTLVHEM